jgi:hypothetical protein
MQKSEQEINKILNDNSKQIEQINKMLLNMNAVSNIRFWCSCLSNFRKSKELNDDILKMEAFTTSIVISYGRIFGSGAESNKLKEKIIPENLFPVHKEIIDLRNGRYAHHGEHSFFEKCTDITYVDYAFVINPKIEVGFWFGISKKWEELFEWLDGYMYDTMHKTLLSLSDKTGVEWKFPNGPAPLYI